MTTAAHHPHHVQSGRQPWTTLALICVAQFMVILDITIVNVALPSIGRALDFAADDLQWVVTAYVVCSGGLLLIGGRVGDLVGRRRAFAAGLALFSLASLASGLAPSPGFLVASRALQGVGAALLLPSALSIVTSVYTGAQRATAMTIWGAIGSAGIGVGVIAGGMLTTWLSWEWIFLVNVPVGAVALLLTTRFVPEVPGTPSARPLDIPGALTVVGGLSLLVYALSGVPTHGWGAVRTIALLAAAAVLLAGFVAIERVVRRPLLPASIWQTGSLVSGAALLLGMTGLLAGSFYLNSLYEQTVLGWSALETGFGFLPFVAAIGIAVHAAGHLLQRFGARAVVTGGLALVVAAAIELSLAPTHASYVSDLLPGFVVLGAGVGLAFPAVQISAMADVDHERAGIASGFIQTAHEIGAALGVAVLAAVAIAGGQAPGQALAQGYGDGYLAVAGIAALLGIVAMAAMTSVRPAPGAKLAMH